MSRSAVLTNRGLIFLSLICVASAGSPAFAARYALLVGVNEYDHPKLHESGALKYAVNDVVELGRVLKEAGYLTTVLTDKAATKETIESQLQEIVRRCQRGDTVVLAFAGHGLQFAGKPDAYFCPVNARPFEEEAGTLVSLAKVYAELEKSFAGVKVLLVDACRNDPTPGRGRGIDADTAPSPPKGVGALFSCSAGQRAFEHDSLKHGVFFHFVLKYLKSHDGEVTFEELALEVRRSVPKKVRQLFPDQKPDQFPNLKADLVGEPPVLMARPILLTPIPERAADGPQLFARWELDGYSYPVTIEKEDAGRTFVRYTDGSTEWAPSWRVGSANAAVGDTVYVNWQNRGYYYPGRVVHRDGRRLRVRYEDGDIEITSVDALRLKLAYPLAKEVGCNVLARWAPDGYWYSGSVQKVQNGKYHVAYDDGDAAWVDERHLYTYLPTTGDRVEANWRNLGFYYAGQVISRSRFNFRIRYDDGSVEDTTLAKLRVDYDRGG